MRASFQAGLAAAAAGAPQQDVVALDPYAEPLGQPVDRALEARIVERHQFPAPITYEVVMVLSAWVRALEPGLAVADLEPFDETVLDQQLEHPIDGGPRGRAAAVA